MKFIKLQNKFSTERDGKPYGIVDSENLISYVRADLIDEVSISFHEDSDGDWYGVSGINYKQYFSDDSAPLEYYFGCFDTFAEAKTFLAEIIAQLNEENQS